MELNTKPHELVKRVNTDEFLHTCVSATNAHVSATNAHGKDDEEFNRVYSNAIHEDKS